MFQLFKRLQTSKIHHYASVVNIHGSLSNDNAATMEFLVFTKTHGEM